MINEKVSTSRWPSGDEARTGGPYPGPLKKPRPMKPSDGPI